MIFRMTSPSLMHHDWTDEQRSISCKGRLVALRTKAESDASFETRRAYIVEIPLKSASKALETVNKAVDSSDLHHLRRFVKPEHLPLHLKEISHFSNTMIISTIIGEAKAIAEGGVDSVDYKDGEAEHDQSEVICNEKKQPTTFFLLCFESKLSSDWALEFLASLHLPTAKALKPQLRVINVPILPPTSEDEATRWSQDFWPTIYKKHNPFGPHSSIVSRAEDDMRASAGEWMSYAESAGVDVSENGIGEPIGAVVVDSNSPQGPSAVIVAADARWYGAGESKGSGNVLAHAVMRAIGLIARKRRALLGGTTQAGTDLETPTSFLDQPLTPAETNAYSRNTLSPGGYLCLGLDIYVTHEPCIMCSMAILHSRFRRIVFWEQLPRTGGLTAEQDKAFVDSSGNCGSLNYGLFWRPELSWKLLAWQWHGADRMPPKLSGLNVHA